jgi:hypothetical protein
MVNHQVFQLNCSVLANYTGSLAPDTRSDVQSFWQLFIIKSHVHPILASMVLILAVLGDDRIEDRN